MIFNSHLLVDKSFALTGTDSTYAASFSLFSSRHDTWRENNVVYIYEPTVGFYYYGMGHPMKPYRLTLTHDLVYHYGLTPYMKCYKGTLASKQDFLKFHSKDYIDFLQRMGSDVPIVDDKYKSDNVYNIGEDCPLFNGLYSFCSLYTGSTLEATKHLLTGETSTAINWSGGLHHAKKAEASGFCYVNDIVLAILEMLKYHPRVLYIDIDVHHGDGVQEAFYNNPRVCTLSFHKLGDGFFPGTGYPSETGVGLGHHFSINVPLLTGIDDSGYLYCFKPIVSEAVFSFRPSLIVLQCGADSLGCDRLGCFNLSIHGHGECVSFVHSFAIPCLVLGGGGYTIKNVSRCWAYETGRIVNRSCSNNIPLSSPHYQYFAPNYKLCEPHQVLVENFNTRSYLDATIATAKDNIRRMQGAPSVQLQCVPVDYYNSSIDVYLREHSSKSDTPDHNCMQFGSS